MENSSLDDALARLSRAGDHLASFKEQTDRFLTSPEGKPVGAALVEGSNDGLVVATFLSKKMPTIMPILAGEAIYNLRAALDYVVYELSVLDSVGGIDPWVPQFLIEDKPSGWKKNERRLKYLSPEHKAAVEALQPFQGCAWTGHLRDLSDPDKHRSLHVVAHAVTMDFGRNDSPPVQHRIEFADETVVIDTLEDFQSNVNDVIEIFRPDFSAY